METPILLSQFASTLIMTGVIWVTQLTQYPSFQWFREKDFVENHGKYRVRIALVATPVMLVEFASGLFLLIQPPELIGRFQAAAGFSLLLIAWGSMILQQVPLHERLSKGFDSDAAKRLVSTNWLRTFSWTCRAVLVIYWIYEAIGH